MYPIKHKHTKHATIYKMIKKCNQKNINNVINEKAVKQKTSYDLYIF
jgi:hypothetical protein